MGPKAIPLAVFGAQQHGVVSRRQLLEAGWGPAAIKRLVRDGHLHQLHTGVYAVGHPQITQEGRWLAAVLACGSGAVLSHWPAGQALGIVPGRERFALHVSIDGRACRDRPEIVTHRPRNLDAGDMTTRLRIPVTTATRTVWDLAAVTTPTRTRRAFEQAEKRGDLDRTRLRALLDASPSRKGSATIRKLLADRPLPLAETRSWLEELLLRICRDHGLPLPTVNVPLLGFEVDFLWRDARFVVEADGADHLDPGRRDADNERDSALGRAGYLVRRYSYRAMAREKAVAEEVLAILEERSAVD